MSNQAKHTPGPWIYTGPNDHGVGSVYSNNAPPPLGEDPVCHGLLPEDAPLIAAAPDMYEALKRAKHIADWALDFVPCEDEASFNSDRRMIEGAIAKAEGREG